MSNITKGERTELKSVVRNQFRVLRDEVLQREAELVADIDKEIAERWADRDVILSKVEEKLQALADEANTALRTYIAEVDPERSLEIHGFRAPEARHRVEDSQQRMRLRAAAVSDLRARVGSANTKLGRQEADLLRTLAIGSLETDEARGFLNGIPSVAELVPASRLQEIEAGLGDDPRFRR